MTIQSNVSHQTSSVPAAQRAVPAVLALMFGAFLVFGTGFAHSNTVHNAAHDTRHAFAFPCH